MTSGHLAIVFSVCFVFATSANAQLADLDRASEPDNRATGANPPTPGLGDEASPAENSTAATGNSFSICQMVKSAAAANGLPVDNRQNEAKILNPFSNGEGACAASRQKYL
jgi:hypothetical protein